MTRKCREFRQNRQYSTQIIDHWEETGYVVIVHKDLPYQMVEHASFADYRARLSRGKLLKDDEK
jgi:hypothetical protein